MGTREKRVHTCVKKGSIDYLYMHTAQVSDKIIWLLLLLSKYYDHDHQFSFLFTSIQLKSHTDPDFKKLAYACAYPGYIAWL
jgi:hypothetical protein